VTVIHAQKADRQGNVLLWGILGVQKEAALAAKRVVVTVEEIVDDLRAPPNACVLPQWVISAVSLVPGGAFPSYALGYYERDNRFYKAWNAIARERDTFLAWMRRHILQTVDFAEFRRTLESAPHEAQRS
jgi:glutaconate CoA-transferase subunit A